MTTGPAAPIWQRICIVGGVATELLGINATSASPRLQVVVFPGNPGSAVYFKPFMLAVYERLRGHVDVLAVTHAGHDPETDHGGRLWDLSQQISHKVAFLREHVLLPGRPPVVLVGHSIGAAMAIKAVAELEGLQVPTPIQAQKQTQLVAKLVAVFPFFETNFGGSWRQRRLRALAPWYDWMGWVGAAVTSLPWALRRAFVRLNASMDSDAVDLTCRLLARHTVRNAFFLASHEFKDLSTPWDWDLLAAYGSRLHVMGCEADTWMSRKQYDDMCGRVPGLQATWHPDLRHAFCISERQSAAVADAVAAVARSIPDLDLDLDVDLDLGADLDLACAQSDNGNNAAASVSRLDSSETATSSTSSPAAAAGLADGAADTTMPETVDPTASETDSRDEVGRTEQQEPSGKPPGLRLGQGHELDTEQIHIRYHNELNHQGNHHQPHDDQLVPCGQTSQQRRQLYGDDVVAGHHRNAAPPAAAAAAAAVPAAGAAAAPAVEVDGDVDDAADQSSADGAAALYGKAGRCPQAVAAAAGAAVAGLPTSGDSTV